MKGLILNNFYGIQDHVKLSIIIAVAVSVIFLGVGKPEVFAMAIGLQIVIFPANIASSLQLDEASKWNKMEVTLPVRRRTVIQAKYITFMVLILLGVLCSLTIPAIAYILGMTLEVETIIQGYTHGLNLAIGTLAILYPAILIFGSDKAETMLLVAVFMSLGIRFGVWGVMNLLQGGFAINFNSYEVGVATLVVIIILFFISYKVSACIHEKKNFA